jgi:hypothetical protein
MTTSRKSIAIVVAGVVATSGAYALGSQAGDGSASARGSGSGSGSAGEGMPGDGRGARHLEGLAERLGVQESRLREALRELRAEHRDGFARRLARELGLDAARVRAALERMHDEARRHHPGALAEKRDAGEARPREDFRGPPREGRPRGGWRHGQAAELARALGVDAERVRTALERVRADEPGRRDAFATDLAERLDIPVERVRDALPHHGRHG